MKRTYFVFNLIFLFSISGCGRDTGFSQELPSIENSALPSVENPCLNSPPQGPMVEIESEDINPTTDIQHFIDTNPQSTTFSIRAGVYHIQAPIFPKRGNKLIGEPGTLFTGSKLLGPECTMENKRQCPADSYWQETTPEGVFWVAEGQTQDGQRGGLCGAPVKNADGTRYSGCKHPEDLFFNDIAQFQVETLAEVDSQKIRGLSKWYFDHDNDKIYFNDDPRGRKVEISAQRFAIGVSSKWGPEDSADFVTIRGITFEKFANPAQFGVIHGDGLGNSSLGKCWTIESNEVRYSHGTGIRVGQHWTIRDNYVHHNGQLGIGGGGDNVIVEGNEIAHNNSLFYSSGWEAGGTKFVRSRYLQIRDNIVHHNEGPGLWTDGDNIYVVVENNHVYNNASMGIFHEISYDAVIRHNIVEGNGFGRNYVWLWGAGILIAHSSNVEVYANYVYDNRNGIAGIQQSRTPSKIYGPHELKNLWVHDNEVIMREGQSGVAQDVCNLDNPHCNPPTYQSGNNRFDNNTYTIIGSNARYFTWWNTNMTWDEWQLYGMDRNGVHNP